MVGSAWEILPFSVLDYAAKPSVLAQVAVHLSWCHNSVSFAQLRSGSFLLHVDELCPIEHIAAIHTPWLQRASPLLAVHIADRSAVSGFV